VQDPAAPVRSDLPTRAAEDAMAPDPLQEWHSILATRDAAAIPALLLPGSSTLRAPPGFVHQTTALIELLLARCEYELTTTIPTRQGSVCEGHRCALLVR